MSETRYIGTLRKGSQIAYWQPNGFPEGIIETNPDFPPRIHYFDGRGTVEMVPVKVPVMQPPRHEHMPVIVGQEYPRDIAPIVDRTVTETRWMLPEIEVVGEPVIEIGTVTEELARWSDAEIEILQGRADVSMPINRIKKTPDRE